MKKYATYALIAAVFSGLALLLDPASPEFVILSGIAVGAIFVLIAAAIDHSDHIRLALSAMRYWNQHVRLSISYLFRIKVDGDYLLVRSDRYADQFQPVGGVYKWHDSAKDTFRGFGVLDDNFLPVDDTSRSDLRIRVRGRHLLAFAAWFESGHNREIGGWREFNEELLSPGILPREPFQTIAYDYIRRVYRPIRYSRYAQSRELLVADIFELLPTPAQLNEIRALRQQGDERIRFVSEEQISRLGGSSGQGLQLKIGENAQWTVD